MYQLQRGGINLICLIASLLLSSTLIAAPRRQTSQDSGADNSKMNQGDASKGRVTADQQKMNAADRDITRNIRSVIVKDKSLSTYAHNIKIISQDGKVTLKGPVHSSDEKTNIVGKATAIVGVDNVTDQLTIASGNDKGAK